MIILNKLPCKVTIPCQCCGKLFTIKDKTQLRDASNFGYRCDKCLKELFRLSLAESNHEFEGIN